jgi:hypothetical protein
MGSKFSKAVAVIGIGIALSFSRSARADFILTKASGVYQHSNGSTKVVLSSKNGAQGIFVMVGTPVTPQEFDLEQAVSEGANHVFIKFDEQAQPPTYSEILVNDRSYKVSGNLTLDLGSKTFVSIDNNNPYLTVVTEGSQPGEASSILGFSGLNEIVKGSGAVAAILAANQLNPEVAKIIHPYEVRNNELLLNGKPASGRDVGTFIRPENDCLNPSSIILRADEVTQIQQAKSEDQRLQLLERFLKDSKQRATLKQHLVLKADKRSVILLDIREKNVREMHTAIAKASRQRICVLTDISTD